MDHYYFLQILFMFFLILSLTSGRALFYDELDSDDYQKQLNSQSNISNSFPDDFDDDDGGDIAYKKREFHQRSIFPTSSASHNRQQIIELLRKAYRQGWKPNLKHHIPATRFGRHRR